MNSKVPSWLKIEIKLPFPKRTTPSPLFRKIKRVLLYLFLAVFCIFAIWRTVLFFEIKHRFAQIRAAGLPASGAELNTWHPALPDPENGALVLTQAFALMRSYPDRRSNEVAKPNILWRTNSWSPVTRELVQGYLQTNVATLAKTRDALRLSRFVFTADFSYGPEIKLLHLKNLKALARIAALQTALEAEDGHADEWPAYAELQLKLASTLNEEPIAISYLLRNAIIAMAAKATERSLNRATPNEQACQKLQSAFTEAGKTNLLPFVLTGERAIMLPVFRLSRAEAQHASEEQTDDSPRTPQRYSGKPMRGLWLTGFFERDLNFYLKTMDKAISLVALPLPASLALTNYLDSASQIASKRLYIMSWLTLPALARLTTREASTQASLRLAATALAIERFRLQQNRLPDTLAELTPRFIDSVPPDPFDGAPLRYRKLPRGYVIYSIGADGHDDGGREPPPDKKSSDKSSYDLTFVVEH